MNAEADISESKSMERGLLKNCDEIHSKCWNEDKVKERKNKRTKFRAQRKSKRIDIRNKHFKIPNKNHKESTVEIKTVQNTDFKQLCIDLSDLQKAQCIPNGNKLIECFICGEKLTKIYKLRSHLQLHTRVEEYDEKELEKSSIYSILNPHQRNIETKVVRDFLIGEILGKRYSQFYGILNEASIELHISDSETESDNGSISEQEIPKNTYKCDICKASFDRRYKALFHQKTIHSNCNLNIECDYCGYQFIGIELLIHHLKTQCECDEKPISCVERFKQYLLKVNLTQFESLAQARKELKKQRLTTAQKIYTCNVCQKTFTRSEHLTRHKAVHLPEELKFECPVCFRRFNRKDNMRSHMKVHIDEAERDNSSTQPILCQYCGHCFTSKSNYVVHMRRHTGEKPYKCDVCGKGFPKSTDLNSHKITHSGEKNFVCNICNKAFARSAVLSKHMRTHAGPFHCNLCEQSFPRPNELAAHLLTHANGARTCTCIVCNCNFTTSQDLKAHFVASGHDNLRATTEKTQLVKISAFSSQTEISTANVSKDTSPEIAKTLTKQLTQISTSTLNEKENSSIELVVGETSNVILQSTFDMSEADVAPNVLLQNSTGLLQDHQQQQQQENNIYETWQ